MVHGGSDSYPLGDEVQAIGLRALVDELQSLRSQAA